MAGSTAKYGIPLLTVADPVAQIATIMSNLANRVDLLLGESGQVSFTGAATTDLPVAVVLSRVYPGNNAAAVPGIVIVQPVSLLTSASNQMWYVNTWTGSGTTITGFTIHLHSSTAPAARLFNWRFIPVL